MLRVEGFDVETGALCSSISNSNRLVMVFDTSHY